MFAYIHVNILRIARRNQLVTSYLMLHHVSEDASEEAGFPLSEFLQRNKVGIGRQARNLASQSVNRRAQDTEVHYRTSSSYC